MKILYAIQGTGNGHLTRAMEIIPYLQQHGETDILISGTQSNIELGYPVKYRFNGLSFVFGKKGGVDLWNTYLKMNSKLLMQEVKKLPVEEYDLVISDFEPVSAWACKRANKPCIGLSNQVATLHPKAPKPKKIDLLGKLVLERYAPTTHNYGMHFQALDATVYTPIIRKQVRELKLTNERHYTVYLPSYDNERIVKNLRRFKHIDWQVFSKHSSRVTIVDNITLHPLDPEKFLHSMASAEGVMCNAGFGTTSEALFMQKKLLVIPMKTQFEQYCNAAMLNTMGVAVIKKLKKKHAEKIHTWLDEEQPVKVNYPDLTKQLVDTLVRVHGNKAKALNAQRTKSGAASKRLATHAS